jgi:hypothetical protein
MPKPASLGDGAGQWGHNSRTLLAFLGLYWIAAYDLRTTISSYHLPRIVDPKTSRIRLSSADGRLKMVSEN